MRELPDGWEWRRTDEVGEVQLGRQRSPSHADGLYMRSYLRVANVFDGHIDYSDVLEMNFIPSEFETYRLRAGDILLNEGQSLELVGRNAVYDGPEGMCFQNTLVRFRPRLVTPGFARAVFKYWFDSGVFKRIARQTTSIAHLGADRFAALPFPLPPAREQYWITEILDALDSKIAQAERLLAKREAVDSALVEQLFRYCSGSSVSLIDTALPVRGSTVIGPFGSNLVAGDYKKTGRPVVFVRDIRASGFCWNSDVYVSESKAMELRAHGVQAGDLLLTKMGAPPCIAAVYPADMSPGVITADIIRLRPNTRIVDVRWLACAVNHVDFRRQVRAISGGVTRSKVTLRDVRHLKVNLPSLADQRKTSSVISKSAETLEMLTLEQKKLLIIKQGIMADLLAGRAVEI